MRATTLLCWIALAACGEGRAKPHETPDAGAADLVVTVGGEAAQVDDRFLSYAVDAAEFESTVYGWADPWLRTATAALGPAYVRFGGTPADDLYYDPTGTAETPEAPYEGVLSADELSQACEFARAVGAEIIFTLNAACGPREGHVADGAWIPDQAEALVREAVLADCPVAVWEFGNEVNLYGVDHVDGAGRPCLVEATRYAEDFTVARDAVLAIDPDALLAAPSSLFLPTLCELQFEGLMNPILEDFLREDGELVDIVTWHYYPQKSDVESCDLVPAPEATLESTLEPEALDAIVPCAEEVEALAATNAPDAPVWLDETGHALCGGQEGVSNRFVSALWWLDELGLLARRGERVVVRQALTEGRYALLDDNPDAPVALPDYFASLLWKRLMGQIALEASGSTGVRAYAHCAASGEGVTALAINLGETGTSIDFPGLSDPEGLYLLTAPALDSPEIDLNGVPLALSKSGAPPALEPAPAAFPIVLPARSIAFVSFPQADLEACR